MKTKTISITYTRKFNLGNYESLEISAFMCGEAEEGEDEQAVALLLGEQAKEAVYATAEEELEGCKYRSAIKRFFMGKEVSVEDAISSEIATSVSDGIPF